MPPALLTLSQASVMLGVSERTLQRWHQTGAFPGVRVNRVLMFHAEQVAAHLEAARASSVLSVAQVADELGCSEKTVRRLIQAGELVVTRSSEHSNARIQVKRSDLLAYQARTRQRPRSA